MKNIIRFIPIWSALLFFIITSIWLVIGSTMYFIATHSLITFFCGGIGIIAFFIFCGWMRTTIANYIKWNK